MSLIDAIISHPGENSDLSKLTASDSELWNEISDYSSRVSDFFILYINRIRNSC